ncbi:MAG: efflux RND transporter permease subunit, partial [Bacteroidales bacterium]|nr:efflux RND transporter permease subunit [Bacteroidales bacterium]
CVAAGICLFFVLMKSTPTGMVPEEDKGSIYVDVTCPMGSSLQQTSAILAEVQAAVNEIPEIGECYAVAGQGLVSGVGSNCGLMFIRLIPWSERTGAGQDVNSVMNKIYMATAHIKGATVFAMAPPMIDGYGAGNSIELWVQDQQGRNIKEFNQMTQEYVQELGNRPEVAMAYCSYNVDYPQYVVDIDAEMCQRRGVAASDVLACINGYCAGTYASNFNRFSHIYRVMIQAKPDMVVDEYSLNSLYVRMNNGEMAPVSQFITIQKVFEPMELKRFNLYTTIPVNVMPAPGYSSGDVIDAVREVASEKLPMGCSVDFSGMAREQATNSASLGFVLAICIFFAYLVLAALYESIFIPFSILLSIPVGLAGTFIFAKIFGLQNDIYLQVAIIMLIGLLAKTAILLTEYATQCRKAGMTLRQASIFAAKMRLRPVLMTVLTMIFGMLPMISSTGLGANGNRTIGAATVGGSLFGTLSLLLFVPGMYYLFQTLQEKLFKVKFVKSEDALINAEIDRLVQAGELTLPEYEEETHEEE